MSSKGCIHKVKDGEWVGSIALSYGFADWENKIWNDPNNKELRQLRKDPCVLSKGDKLFIPSLESNYETIQTEQRHKFILHSPTEVFRLKILGPEDEVLRNEEYQLSIDCGSNRGKFEKKNSYTDPNGMLTVYIPSNAIIGELYLPRLDYTVKLDFGYLTPMDLSNEKDLVCGVQERLKALGFEPGPIDGVSGPLTSAAVEVFQQFCQENLDNEKIDVPDSGPTDGIIGQKTRDALLEYYGS